MATYKFRVLTLEKVWEMLFKLSFSIQDSACAFEQDEPWRLSSYDRNFDLANDDEVNQAITGLVAKYPTLADYSAMQQQMNSYSRAPENSCIHHTPTLMLIHTASSVRWGIQHDSYRDCYDVIVQVSKKQHKTLSKRLRKLYETHGDYTLKSASKLEMIDTMRADYAKYVPQYA